MLGVLEVLDIEFFYVYIIIFPYKKCSKDIQGSLNYS